MVAEVRGVGWPERSEGSAAQSYGGYVILYICAIAYRLFYSPAKDLHYTAVNLVNRERSTRQSTLRISSSSNANRIYLSSD